MQELKLYDQILMEKQYSSKREMLKIERRRLTMITAISQKKVLTSHGISIFTRSLDLVQKLIMDEINAF